MPIMDKQTLLCESMSIATTAGSHVHGTNIIDLGVHYNHKYDAMQARYNVGQNLCLNIVVEDEDMAAAVNGSVVTFNLYNGATDNPVDNAGTAIITFAVTENTTTTHPDGTLIASIPIPNQALYRYLELYVTVATQNLSTGKITAWIAPATQLS